MTHIIKDLSHALDVIERLQDDVAFYQVTCSETAQKELEPMFSELLLRLAEVRNYLDRTYSDGFDDYDIADQLELDFNEGR